MKNIKLLITILIIQITVQTINAQSITANNTLAGQYFNKAKQGLENREFQNIDSFLLSFDKAAKIYLDNNMWKEHINAQLGLAECYARNKKQKEAIDLAFFISPK